MIDKFCDRENLGELFGAMTDTARVKRHNTASWVSGNIKSSDYSRLYVPLSELRSQHSVDGKAIEKTSQRAETICNWLQENPQTTSMDLKTLNDLAGSPGALKVGHGQDRQFIMIDGTGRLEAMRQALELFQARTGSDHPLRSVETLAVQLSEQEYSQLFKASGYFLDEQGKQREVPVHDLTPGSALPRLVVGTVMNQVRHRMQLDGPVDRRIPTELDTERPGME